MLSLKGLTFVTGSPLLWTSPPFAGRQISLPIELYQCSVLFPDPFGFSPLGMRSYERLNFWLFFFRFSLP